MYYQNHYHYLQQWESHSSAFFIGYLTATEQIKYTTVICTAFGLNLEQQKNVSTQ